MRRPARAGRVNSSAAVSTTGDSDRVYAKIARRIMPLLILVYVVGWLDRINVGFAKLEMVADLGFSQAIYGFGAGIFYLGYLLFEIPSNLLLERIGARKTIARITILWGLTSVATMFVRTAGSFYLLRFLLGAFEAGLYPGVVLYLTYWFPGTRRAQMLGWFMTAIPLAGIVGGPISGWIMGRNAGALGLANWQWLFLVEGTPSLVMGLVTFAMLVDRPQDARWLTDEEKCLVEGDFAIERRDAASREAGFLNALKLSRVWLLAGIYFCVVSANPTLGFWTPTIIKGLGVANNTTIGLLSAIPYVAAMAGAVLVGRHSDRTGERRYHAALCCLAAAGGLVMIGVLGSHPVLAFGALVMATAGVLSAFAPFWQIPTMMLAGTAAAGGIALINSLGNLSGWLGPSMVGLFADATGRTSTGLYAVAVLELIAAVTIATLNVRPHAARAETSPTGAGSAEGPASGRSNGG